MLGLTGKLGVLAKDAWADLVVLNENPLEDITSLDRAEDNLVAVVKAGRLVAGSLDGFSK